MKSILANGIAALLFGCLSTLSCAAQVVTGTPAFGSFSGGPDVINLGNLNVHLDIPVRNKPGRGTNFTYDLTYDNSIWYPAFSNGVGSWQPVANFGWNGLQPAGNRYISYSMTYTSSICQPNQYHGYSVQSWTFGNLMYTDEHGVVHTFSGAGGSYIEVENNPGPPCPSTGAEPSGTMTTNDGAGMTAQYSLNAGSMSVTILDKSGNAINAPVYVNYTAPSNTAGSVTDAYGNQITWNNGTYTDTLGTTALGIVQNSNPTTTTLSYVNSSGGYATYTVYYTSAVVQTYFNCNSIGEYSSGNAVNLVSQIELPDQRSYYFHYEPSPNPNAPAGAVTGRLIEVDLPTGGKITYQYNGSNDGVSCSDGSTMNMTRTVYPGGSSAYPWTYARSYPSSLNSAAWQTVVTAPSYGSVSDDTVVTLLTDGSGVNTNFYEIARQVYSGSHTSGSLLDTVLTCYESSDSQCSNTSGDTGTKVASFSRVKRTNLWPSGLASTTIDQYDGFLNNTSHAVYDYASIGTLGTLLSTTTTTYQGSSTAEQPQEVKLTDGSAVTVSDTQYVVGTSATQTSGTPNHVSGSNTLGYVTAVKQLVSGSTYLTTNYSYYDTGNVYQATDPNGTVTTYAYGNCGNSLVTQISTPVTVGSGVTLTTGAQWDCDGGVPTSSWDVNQNQTTYSYGSDPYWRPTAVTNVATNTTTQFSYPSSGSPNTSSSTLTFYNSASVNSTVVTTDGLGRTLFTQQLQAPGYGYYDTVATTYDSRGRVATQSLPYTAAEGVDAGAPTAVLTTTYDALNRPVLVTDAGNGTVAYSYAYQGVANDTLVTKGPAPTGEHAKSRVLQYNGAGQLAAVCEVTTSLPGYGTCGNMQVSGYLTQYTYDGPNLTETQQNAQSGNNGVQTRQIQYDDVGRKTWEKIPEWSTGSGTPGTASYTYDSDTSGICPGGYPGDLVKSIDNAGNVTCYTYDSMHRVLTSKVVSGTYSQPSITPQAYFVYDAATLPNTQQADNVKGQLARAYTYGCQGTNCTPTLQTDEYFSYSLVTSGSMQGGVLAQMWQSTPNSGGYFLTQDTLYPNGALGARTSVLGSASYGYPNMSYGLDGEGRPYWAADATNSINPVTATTYNAAGAATSVSFGNACNGAGADVDSFQYDPYTNRPTSLNSFVNASASPFNVHTQLTWNSNGSLNKMAYSDENDTSKNQTCGYSADDLSRISSVQCGSAWAQTFSYDPFGNISKAGSSSYAATYGGPNSATQTNQVSGGFSPAPQYDSNGNQLNLTAAPASLSWNAWNVPININGTTATYDALGRMVEKVAGTATQFVYSPSGAMIASVSGGALVKGTVQLPGGDTAIYSGTSGVPYIRHTDWLGSSRLATTWAHGVQSKVAYAPFGETYNEAGSAASDRSFTGQDQNVAQGSLGTGVYDYLFRKYDPSAGRWLSPDPLGWGAANADDPQSLNRYAYVENNPMRAVDPTGLDCITVSSDGGLYTNSGDCLGIDPNNEYYIDCDGCLTGASGYINANGTLMINTANGDIYDIQNVSYTSPDGSPTDFNDSFDAMPNMDPGNSSGPQTANGGTAWYHNSCITSALAGGAGKVGLDAIGLIPEAGGVARIIGHGAGYVGVVADQTGSRIIKAVGASQSAVRGLNGLFDTSPQGLISDGLTIAGFIPGLGQAAAIGSIIMDTYQTAKAISQCQ